MLNWLLGREKPLLGDRIRAHKRGLERTKTIYDNNMYALERDQAKIIEDLKSAIVLMNNKRKIVFLCKKYVAKVQKIGGYQNRILNLEELQHRLDQIEDSVLMRREVRNTNNLYDSISRDMSVTELEKELEHFEKEATKMDLFSERLDDAMMMSPDNIEYNQDGDDLIRTVMDMVGMKELEGCIDAPKRNVKNPEQINRAVNDMLKNKT